jgi:hypothetical protein
MKIFTELNAFARKVYKFQQRKSDGLTQAVHGDNFANGVCFGLVMMWVREKFATTGAWYRDQHQNFSPAPGGDVHERNGITMLQAAEYQRLYRWEGVDLVAYRLRLRPATTDIRPVVGQGREFIPQVQILATLVRVGEHLPPGEAAVIELDVHGAGQPGGHAIGMYRSRGRQLYLFDPTIGVYEIHNLAGFMQAWIDGYRNGRGWTFSPFRNGTDWLHYYAR